MRKELIIILLTVLILLFSKANVHAYFFANEGCTAYEGGCEQGIRDATKTIKGYIIDGAGYFLKSNSDMQLFLSKIELSELNGTDYSELQNIINSAIENMENAKETYINLISIAKRTPYNPSVIEKLQLFDYSSFQEKNKLNADIFKQVETFLSNGNVNGIFEKLKEDMENILKKLYNIKSGVDSSRFPELSELWQVNQMNSVTMLFGQYATEILYALK